MKQKLTGNFIAIYKKGNKDAALKKMENLKTRIPNKIIKGWDEVLEYFNKNKRYLLEISNPDSEIFIDLTEHGFEKEKLLGCLKNGEIKDKEVLCEVVGFYLYTLFDEEFSIDEDFNLVNYNLYEEGEFRSFEEIKTIALEEFLNPGEEEKLRIIEMIIEEEKRLNSLNDEEEKELREDIEPEEISKIFIVSNYYPAGAFIQKGIRFELLMETSEHIDFNDLEIERDRINETCKEIISQTKEINKENYEVTIFEVEHPQDYDRI